MPAEGSPRRGRALRAALSQPKLGVMLALGFSSGLPFMLVGNTLGFWLREAGTTLTAIGFLSWVGLAYSLKFLWAPVIDRVDAPLLGGWLGRRRGWMAAAQLLVMAGLLGMALLRPEGGLTAFGALALLAAFASSTQDIVIDAWRIESAADDEEQGLLTAAYQAGYRAALLTTDALILIAAAWLGWPLSYTLMAAGIALGLFATLAAVEPAATVQVPLRPLWQPRGLFDAVAGPFIAFFRDQGRWALLVLTAVALYRLGDFAMGPMANPFYRDLGLSKEVVGAIRGSVGLVAAVAGIAAAGISALRLGFVPTLLIGAVLGPGSNLAFTLMAVQGTPDRELFAAAMATDNFSAGFAGTALVGYMSSLTRLGYTATQYALLSSFYALPGKFAKGLSGAIVDALVPSQGLMGAYAWFFAGTALIGVPALLLCALLARRRRSALPADS